MWSRNLNIFYSWNSSHDYSAAWIKYLCVCNPFSWFFFFLFVLFCFYIFPSHSEVQIITNCHLQAFLDQTSYYGVKVQITEWEWNWILQVIPLCFRPETSTRLSLFNPVTLKQHLWNFSRPCMGQNAGIQEASEHRFLLFQQLRTLFDCLVFPERLFIAYQLHGCHDTLFPCL